MTTVEMAETAERMMAKCRKWTSFRTAGRLSSWPLPHRGAGMVKSSTIRMAPTTRLIIRPQKAP